MVIRESSEKKPSAPNQEFTSTSYLAVNENRIYQICPKHSFILMQWSQPTSFNSLVSENEFGSFQPRSQGLSSSCPISCSWGQEEERPWERGWAGFIKSSYKSSSLSGGAQVQVTGHCFANTESILSIHKS